MDQAIVGLVHSNDRTLQGLRKPVSNPIVDLSCECLTQRNCKFMAMKGIEAQHVARLGV